MCVAGVEAAYILARDTLVIHVLVRADTMDVLAEYTCQHDEPLSLFCLFPSRFLALSLLPPLNLPSLFRPSSALVTSDRFHALPARFSRFSTTAERRRVRTSLEEDDKNRIGG